VDSLRSPLTPDVRPKKTAPAFFGHYPEIALTASTIQVGAVVRDQFGREGIVLAPDAPPSPAWLSAHVEFDFLRALGPDVPWWGVLPFGGGYLLCAAPVLTYLRAATYDDFLMAADAASADARATLSRVLPHHTATFLAASHRCPGT